MTHRLDEHKLQTDPVEELTYAAESLLQEEFDAGLQKERQFDIWAEGYAATGESGRAVCFGAARGTTFKEACDNYAAADPQFRNYYDSANLTYWGCRLFDNERAARKSFG